MKKFAQLFTIAIVAMFTLLPGCGKDYEHGKKKFHDSCALNSNECADGLVCGNERELKGICTTWDVARCNNGVQDYSESDVDCGWSCRMAEPPNLCEVGKKCVFSADCDGTKNLVCDSGVCKTPGTTPPNNNVCSSSNPCPTGQNCVSGVCYARNFCTPDCTSGHVCIDNVCVVGTAQYILCATPTTNSVFTCWDQFIAGKKNVDSQSVSANSQICCPEASGSFTVPNGTTGTYTGWQHASPSRPFQTWTNDKLETVTGGFF
ncbi:MAG: hypothetical protein WC725_01580 [Patescibacteria group bacterium]|jgi:hypothetical protein